MALETTALYRKRVRTNRVALVLSVLAMLIGMSFLLWYAVTKTWLLVPVFLIGLVVLGGLSGLLLAYYFTSVGAFAALSALNFLCFLLLWLLTVLLLAGLVRHY